MKQFSLITASLFCFVVAQAQQQKDTVPVSKEKMEFFKNYADYLIKSKTNKPKASVDSSLFVAKTKPIANTPNIKSGLPSQEIKGTLSGKKQAIEITPDKPQPPEKKIVVASSNPIPTAISANNDNASKQVKFVFDTTKTTVAKTTVDSSIYLFPQKKSIVKEQQPVNNSLKGQLIKGTLDAEKKSTVIVPKEEIKVVVPTVASLIATAKPEPPKMIYNNTTVDSSVYLYPQKKAVVKQQELINKNLKAQTIQGTINAEKKSTVIEPGEKTKVVTSFNSQSAEPPRMIFNNTTIDSSVFMAKTKPSSNQPVVKANVKGYELSGTLTPSKNKSVQVAPGISLIQQQISAEQSVTTLQKKYEFVEKPPAKNPSAVVDTNLINIGTDTQKIATDLKPQFIKGTFAPNNKNNIIKPFVDTMVNSLIAANPYAERVSKNIDLQKVKGDALSMYSVPPANSVNTETKTYLPTTNTEASNYVDPLANYTVPNVKGNYKSQTVSAGSIILPKTIVEPISPDSVAAIRARDSLQRIYIFDSTKNANEAASAAINTATQYAPNYTTNNNLIAYVDSRQNTHYNFYLTQTGRFSVSISTANFYLNVDQRGQMADYGLINNGVITKGSNDKRITQPGVGYNPQGLINNIAGIDVTYAYDGRINKVGNTYINYNYEGVIEKVGETTVQYNSNFTAYRIGPFGVAYNSMGNVIGVDDSGGLIVFKP